MISCHECVYGETLQVGTEWTTSFRKSASTAAWGEVVTAAARYGPDDTFESFEFTVSGHRVCTDKDLWSVTACATQSRVAHHPRPGPRQGMTDILRVLGEYPWPHGTGLV